MCESRNYQRHQASAPPPCAAPPPRPVGGDQGPRPAPRGACGDCTSAWRPAATCQGRYQGTPGTLGATGRCRGSRGGAGRGPQGGAGRGLQGLRGLPEAGPTTPSCGPAASHGLPQAGPPAPAACRGSKWSPGAPWAGTAGEGLLATAHGSGFRCPTWRLRTVPSGVTISVVYSRNRTDDQQVAVADAGPRGEGKGHPCASSCSTASAAAPCGQDLGRGARRIHAARGRRRPEEPPAAPARLPSSTSRNLGGSGAVAPPPAPFP